MDPSLDNNMPETTDQLVSDFDRYLRSIADLKDWIRKLFYDPAFSRLFTRPILSLLITACEYIEVNLTELKRKYVVR